MVTPENEPDKRDGLPQSRRFASDKERDAWLREHVRYRLIAVDGLAWFCEVLLGAGSAQRIAFTLNGTGTDYFNVTNAVVDAGLAHGRALLEFFGLRCRKGRAVMESVKRRRESKYADVWPADLGLRDVAVDRAIRLGPATANETARALTYFLSTANKGVAHLAYGEPGADVAKLLLASRTIRAIARDCLREANVPSSVLDSSEHGFRHVDLLAKLLGDAKASDGVKR